MANKCLIYFDQKIRMKEVLKYSLVAIFRPESDEFNIIKNRYDCRTGIINSNIFEKLIREYGIVAVETSE